jgi:hypothetical protein
MSHSKQTTTWTKEEVVGPLIINRLIRTTGDSQPFPIDVESGGQSYRTEDSELTPGRLCQNWVKWLDTQLVSARELLTW